MNFKKLILITTIFLILLSCYMYLNSCFIQRPAAYLIDNNSIVGETAKIYKCNHNLYVISSNSSSIVFSKIENDECKIIESFPKESWNFSTATIVNENLYIAHSSSNKTQIIKYTTETGFSNSYTIENFSIDNEDQFAVSSDSTVFLLNKENKSEVLVGYNLLSENPSKIPEKKTIRLDSISVIKSIKQDVSGTGIYVNGLNISNQNIFIHFKPQENPLIEHNTGINFNLNYKFITDNMILTSDGEVYEKNQEKDFWEYKFNSFSSDNEMVSAVLNEYIFMSMGDGLIYALDKNTYEAKYKIDQLEDVVDISATDDYIFIITQINDNFYITRFSIDDLTNITPIVFSSGIQTKSKEDIINLNSESKPLNQNKDTIYSEIADLENFKNAGQVNNVVLIDGIRAVNFYRNLYNLPTLTIDENTCDAAQYGAVLAVVSDDILNPTKPKNMSEEFYSEALNSIHGNFVKTYSNLSSQPIVDAVYSLFESDYSFRKKLLDRSLSKISFGVCSTSDGKTSILVYFEQKPEYSSGYNFTPYPNIGFYPSNYISDSTLTINLGNNLFAGDRGTPSIYVTNLSTSQKHSLTFGNDFTLIDNNKGISINNIGFTLTEDTLYKITINNLYTKDGLCASIEYQTSLFKIIEPDPDNPDNPDDPDSPVIISSSVYNIDRENNIITGIRPGTTLSEIKKNITYDGYSLTAINYKNIEVTSGVLGTSAKLQFSKNSKLSEEFYIVIYGDITGEGNVNTRDTKLLSNYLLGMEELNKYALLAADTNHDGSVNTLDLLKIQNYLNGGEEIIQ